MGQLIVSGITFIVITKEQDSDGPYYTSENFPAIKIYRPNTGKNITDEWFAEDVDESNTFLGDRAKIFKKAATWVKQKEEERIKLSQNKTTKE